MTPSLFLAIATISFGGYVPPHASNDGMFFQVSAEAATDLPTTLKACGIDDFAKSPAVGAQTTYQFAVTRSGEASAGCVRSRLPAGARLTQLDRWTKAAQAD